MADDYFLDAANPGMYLDDIPTKVLLFLMARIVDHLQWRETQEGLKDS